MRWAEYSQNKILLPQNWASLRPTLESQGKKLATLNGSFDILHAGHLHILYEAAQTADVLLVAVNSDASVRGYKGASRPFIPLAERMQLLSAIAYIDYVTWFEELDPCAFLRSVRPHVHVNGMEYGTNCIEAPVLQEIGAKLHLVDRIPGLATTALVEKIRCASSAQ